MFVGDDVFFEGVRCYFVVNVFGNMMFEDFFV